MPEDHVGYRAPETDEDRTRRRQKAIAGVGVALAGVLVYGLWERMPEWPAVILGLIIMAGLLALWEAVVDRSHRCRKCTWLVGTETAGLPAACPNCGADNYTTYLDGLPIRRLFFEPTAAGDAINADGHRAIR